MEKEKISMPKRFGTGRGIRSQGRTSRGRRVSTCARARAAVCCADGLRRAGTGRGKSNGSETCGNECGVRCGTSGAVLSELFDGIERERVQVEVPVVRVLLELLGFLLRVKWQSFLTGWAIYV